MNITSVKVDWYEQFDNQPCLEIGVDAIPQDLVYSRKGPYYYCEKDGMVKFLVDNPGDHHGFGGRHFELKMDDGSTKTLIGPWSGNADGAMHFGFPLSIKVILWDKDYRCSAHVTEAFFLEAMKRVEDVAHAVKFQVNAPVCNLSSEQCMVVGSGEAIKGKYSYLIARKGMTYSQSQAYKKAKRLRDYYFDEKGWQWHGGLWQTKEGLQEMRDRHMASVNELIEQNGLEAFGLPKIGDRLLVQTVARPQEPVYSFDEESDNQQP